MNFGNYVLDVLPKFGVAPMGNRPTPPPEGEHSGNEIEVTPEMIEAGEAVFFEEMLAGDYLAAAPVELSLRSMLANIFVSMAAKSRSFRKKSM